MDTHDMTILAVMRAAGMTRQSGAMRYHGKGFRSGGARIFSDKGQKRETEPGAELELRRSQEEMNLTELARYPEETDGQ